MSNLKQRFSAALRILLLATLGTFSFTCSGGETHFARQPTSIEQAVAYCDAFLSYANRCDPTHMSVNEFAYNICRADKRIPLVFSAFTVAMTRCILTLECSVDNEVCRQSTLQQFGINLDQNADHQRCVERVVECDDPAITEPLNDTECVFHAIFYDKAQAAIHDCLALSCDEYRACMKDPTPYIKP